MGKPRRIVRRTVGNLPTLTPTAQRDMLVAWCRAFCDTLDGKQTSFAAPASSKAHISAGTDLPPRLQQTLSRLLAGDSEKQVAARLGLSPHTVHTYVKALHKRFCVASRGELLARFVTINAAAN